MGLLESLQTVAGYLASTLGGSQVNRSEGEAVAVSRWLRPFAPETPPNDLPQDLPVMSDFGFHHRPHASPCRYGEVSLVYSPRAEFEEVVAFHEERLPASRWMITDVHDDRADGYRVRRFEVQRDARKGSIAVEESLEDHGPIPRRLVTVIVDIPCRE